MKNNTNKKGRKKFENIDQLWKSQPETIRQFLNNKPDYEQLCVEVAYILQKAVESQKIEVAAVTYRAKTLNSFLEKFQRKIYLNPFSDIEDFAGVRIVCLYLSDIPRIEKIIKSQFKLVKKIDKFREKTSDQFGYGAVHFTITLGRTSSGARYDSLRTLKCEVQLRTVLQDSWAIIDHHLVYKRELEIPSQIQRRLNGLAGLLETADDQFEQIRKERQRYLRSLSESASSKPSFLSTEINLDSLEAYLTWRFGAMKLILWDGQLSYILDKIDRKKYKTLKSIDKKIARLFPKIDQIMGELAFPLDAAARRLVVLLCIADEDFRRDVIFYDVVGYEKKVDALAKRLGY